MVLMSRVYIATEMQAKASQNMLHNVTMGTSNEAACNKSRLSSAFRLDLNLWRLLYLGFW